MKRRFGSLPNFAKINNIKFYYVRRTIKINWKEQLKEGGSQISLGRYHEDITEATRNKKEDIILRTEFWPPQL